MPTATSGAKAGEPVEAAAADVAELTCRQPTIRSVSVAPDDDLDGDQETEVLTL